MSSSIQPFREADLPTRQKSFWRMTGPGAVMVGMAVGSGELVLWPWITAKFGASMAWAAAIGIILQVFVNIEVGRWTVATGESALNGFARVHRSLSWIFMLMLALLALLPAWARASGTTLRMLLFGPDGPGADWVWTTVVFALVLAVMFGPKKVYAGIEVSLSLMVFLIVIGMAVVVVRIGTLSDVTELGRGLVDFGHVELDEEFDLPRFFGAVVFAGSGGFGNILYAYYLRDKGIGMGARIAALANPLRSKGQEVDEAAYLYPDTQENGRRFKDWMTYIHLDNLLYFWILNTVTLLLFVLGAMVVLHQHGIVPAQSTIIWDLSLLLESGLGRWGHYLFLIVAMCALFSTQLAATDGGARLWTDVLRRNFAVARKATHGGLYLGLVLVLTALGITSVWFFETYDVTVLDFFFLNAGTNGFAMAIYCPVLMYMNFKYLRRSARPKPIHVVMMVASTIVYLGFAVILIADKFG